MACDGGFVRVTTPIAGNVEALWVFAPGSLWVVGGGNMADAAQRLASDGGFFAATCSNTFDAVWARPDGTAYLAGNNGNLQRVSGAGAACSVLTATTNNRTHGLFGVEGASIVELFTAHDNGTIGYRTDPAGTSADAVNTSAIVTVYAVGGPARGTLFAVGQDPSNNRGRIMANDGGLGWAPVYQGSQNTKLFDLSMATPSLGYAAGEGGKVLRFDGTSWVDGPTGVPANILGVQAFADGAVWVSAANGRVYRSDGSAAFVEVANFSSVTNNLNGLRGTSACDLWVVGDMGLVATTNHP
jgi:hypothetical protein